MVIGERLRSIREEKDLTQGDLELRSGLVRSYISRVEKGRTIPSLATLEKFACALEVPLYRFFYDGQEPTGKPAIASDAPKDLWGEGKDAKALVGLRRNLARISPEDRALLLGTANLLRRKKTRRKHLANIAS